MKEVHNNMATDPMNEQFQKAELYLQKELSNWLSYEEDQWKQRSESWLHLRDKNTKFFLLYNESKTCQKSYIPFD